MSGHGRGKMAHVSGAHQALGEKKRAVERSASLCGGAGTHRWGVSVEDRKYGLPRITHLQDSPATVRFLSIEPLLEDLGEFNLSRISWAIVGGESGPGARPMRKEWVISVRDQCREYHVPFFFKQWGGVRKAKNGRLLDDRINEYRARCLEVPDRELRGVCPRHS